MRNKYFWLALVLMVKFTFTSCSTDDYIPAIDQCKYWTVLNDLTGNHLGSVTIMYKSLNDIVKPDDWSKRVTKVDGTACIGFSVERVTYEEFSKTGYETRVFPMGMHRTQ